MSENTLNVYLQKIDCNVDCFITIIWFCFFEGIHIFRRVKVLKMVSGANCASFWCWIKKETPDNQQSRVSPKCFKIKINFSRNSSFYISFRFRMGKGHFFQFVFLNC